MSQPSNVGQSERAVRRPWRLEFKLSDGWYAVDSTHSTLERAQECHRSLGADRGGFPSAYEWRILNRDTREVIDLA